MEAEIRIGKPRKQYKNYSVKFLLRGTSQVQQVKKNDPSNMNALVFWYENDSNVNILNRNKKTKLLVQIKDDQANNILLSLFWKLEENKANLSNNTKLNQFFFFFLKIRMPKIFTCK